jgi:hypothetical protein
MTTQRWQKSLPSFLAAGDFFDVQQVLRPHRTQRLRGSMDG